MWVRLDDALGDDPRIASAGAIGAGVLVLALCYSNRNLTDGWIPAAVLHRFLTDGKHDGSSDEAKQRLLHSCLLVERSKNGLLGYQIEADFMLLQPTRDEVLKKRGEKSRQKAEAGRLGGIASGEARRKHPRSSTEAAAKHAASTDEAPVPGTRTLQDKSTGADAPAPPIAIRESEVATHAQLCKVYDEILRVEPHSSEADRKEAFRRLLADRQMKADPADPQALRKAMDVVERGHAMTGGFGSRGGFQQIAGRRATA